MENLTAMIKLLGEENEKRLRDGITDIILDYVKEDLNSLNVYLLDWEDMFDEIRKEIKDEIKKEVKKKYLEASNEKINEMMRKL